MLIRSRPASFSLGRSLAKFMPFVVTAMVFRPSSFLSSAVEGGPRWEPDNKRWIEWGTKGIKCYYIIISNFVSDAQQNGRSVKVVSNTYIKAHFSYTKNYYFWICENGSIFIKKNKYCTLIILLHRTKRRTTRTNQKMSCGLSHGMVKSLYGDVGRTWHWSHHFALVAHFMVCEQALFSEHWSRLQRLIYKSGWKITLMWWSIIWLYTHCCAVSNRFPDHW